MTWQQVFYDWGGWNAALFHWINAATPVGTEPLVWIFALAGNYLTAPAAALGLWAWSERLGNGCRIEAIRAQLVRFGLAVAIALLAAVLLKLLLNFPRPPLVFDAAIRVIGEVEYHYSLPSGHATYAALLVATLWTLVGRPLQVLLAIYLIGVGWSRIAAGMHFPADVVAGWCLGLASYAAANRLHTVRKWIAGRAWRLSSWQWHGLAALVACIDQGTKSVVESTFTLAEQISLTPFFNLVYVLNPGAAFSFLADAGGWQ
jgi:signal peptidase II